MRIGKIFRFEAAHVLPGHSGKCARLHGHSYKLEVEVKGPISDVKDPPASSSGMVVDFGDLSALVKELIIDKWDHHMLTSQGQYDLPVHGADWYGHVVELPVKRTTAELLVVHIVEVLGNLINDQYGHLSRVRLWETETGYAEWRADD